MPVSILGKKGMVEMMETFMIILVVFILIGLGMFVFFKASVSGNVETHKDVCLTQATEIMSAITQLPDINCKEKRPCIDTLKLDAFISLPETDKRNVLESSVCKKNITIMQLYPEPKTKGLCNGKTRDPDFPENCNLWTVFSPTKNELSKLKNKAGAAIETPVTLYYPLKEEYGLGKMVITVYAG